ncbi:MAG TPA: plastocyanin/azurin family copper-binding protein [Gemmatimonadales bacterium]|nr:plastocyanin/azurin family copper-binding protein [Gemmatimonadales bacterium]
MRSTSWVLTASLLAFAGCNATNSLYGGGGNTGGVGGGGGGPAGQVVVGNDFFKSAHNGSVNPAVDTITVGSTVTWAWSAAGSHSIQSTGQEPAVFRNSVVMSNANSTYSVQFNTAGTYTYICSVHGAAMSGTIVVQ